LDVIDERVEAVFFTLWVGSAIMAGLVFSPNVPDPGAPALTSQVATRRRLWTRKLRLTSLGLLPLTLVPLLEVRRSGHDPILWLMDGALVITLCSVPYFTLLARGVLGGVVLSIALPSFLWFPVSWWFFSIIKRAKLEGVGTTADPTGMHAFFAPEFRHLFYVLCALILGVYCPIMMALSRRQFLRTARVAEPVAAADGGRDAGCPE
jgi:hypothetical protein